MTLLWLATGVVAGVFCVPAAAQDAETRFTVADAYRNWRDVSESEAKQCLTDA